MEMGNEKNFRGHGYDTQLKNVLELAQAWFIRGIASGGVQHDKNPIGRGQTPKVNLNLPPQRVVISL